MGGFFIGASTMIKRTFLALAFLAGLLSPAFAAGTVSLSLSQQLDKTTYKPLNGGKVYFYAAGTTTPQNAFQDSGLTIPWPNPLTLDSSGRIPQLFFADGQIKIRMTNAAGVEQFVGDSLLVVGPSSGGGGGGTVDPTTVLSTGDTKCKYGTGVLTGFVRRNGRTIGSATSGATERANADAQPLFEYLWAADPNLTVSTGRGVSANADWTANKVIALPDQRGRVIAALDDMGNASANRLGPAMASTTLGAGGGLPNYTLMQTNLPAVSYNLAGAQGTVNVISTIGDVAVGSASIPYSTGGSFINIPGGYIAINSTGSFTPAGSIGPLGSGGAFNIVQPTILETCYAKL